MEPKWVIYCIAILIIQITVICKNPRVMGIETQVQANPLCTAPKQGIRQAPWMRTKQSRNIQPAEFVWYTEYPCYLSIPELMKSDQQANLGIEEYGGPVP